MPEIDSHNEQPNVSGPTDNASASDIDLQKLAEQIYEKLRRELEIENERLGTY
jgi:hypothetical protein